MKIIFGLGNPGLQYKNTRHNVGFMVLDGLVKQEAKEFKKDKGLEGYLTTLVLDKEKVVLCKPDTFMNNSGICVKKVISFFKADSSLEVLVVYDDIDLPLGDLRFKNKGSSGGHNGMASIIEYLNNENIQRLKIGIGRPSQDKEQDIAKYVLSNFDKSQAEEIKDRLSLATLACKDWLVFGMNFCSQKYNK